jgi:ankyrin repeat protein
MKNMKNRSRYLALLFVVLMFSGGCSLFIPSHHKTEDYTPIVEAAERCDLAVVQEAVHKNPAVLKFTEWEGATLLHNAVGYDCKDETEYLLDAGADVNARKKDGVTALHIAARNGNIEIMEVLLKHGANINAVDSKGWTPLDRAEKWNQSDAVKYLRSHGGREGTQ